MHTMREQSFEAEDVFDLSIRKISLTGNGEYLKDGSDWRQAVQLQGLCRNYSATGFRIQFRPNQDTAIRSAKVGFFMQHNHHHFTTHRTGE